MNQSLKTRKMLNARPQKHHQHWTRLSRVLMIILLFQLLHSTAYAFQSENLKPVTLSLKWTHQFQFAGYYMAKEQGYYQQAGLDVRFLEADPAKDPTRRVLDGEAEFGVGTSELILNYVKGDPVVVLGVIMQHSPLGIVTIDPAIKKVEDLRDKKVMIEENSAELFSLLELHGLKRNDYILHRHQLSIKDLIEKKIDAMSIYKTTELSDLQEANIPYQVFYPIESGIDFYGDNLFTTTSMLKQQFKVVDSFRQASYRGWQYAMNNPEKTIRHILEHYVTNRTYEQLHFEAQVMRELMQPERIYPGKMTNTQWNQIANSYVSSGFIETLPDLEGFIYQPEIKFSELYQNLKWLIIGIFTLLILILVLIYALYRLSMQKKEYQFLFKHVPLAVLVLDKNHRVRQWNHQAEQTYGWQQAEVLGKPVFDFLVEDADIQGVKSMLKKVAGEGLRVQLINQNVTKTGEKIICSWTNSPFGAQKAQQIICMAIDISEMLEDIATNANIQQTTPPERKLIFADCQDTIAQTNSLFDEPAQLAKIMHCALTIWQAETGKTKVQLAEESQIWRVTLDGGTAKTRTLDKYLTQKTIPENPRWRNVIDTALFVLNEVPSTEQHAQLQTMIDVFSAHKH